MKKFLSLKEKKNWIFFKNKILVSILGKFFFIKNKKNKDEFRLVKELFLLIKKSNFNINL